MYNRRYSIFSAEQAMPDPPFDTRARSDRTQLLFDKIWERSEYIRFWAEGQSDAMCGAFTAGEEELVKIHSTLASIEPYIMAYHNLVRDFLDNLPEEPTALEQ